MGGFFDFVKPLVVPLATAFGGAALGTALSGVLGDDEEVVTKVGTGAELALMRGKPLISKEALAALGNGGAVGVGVRKRTIVQTLDKAGNVVKSKTHKGGVAVFQADVAAANRVARQVRKLDKRMPKKIVKQSEIARLKEEVTESALRHARDSNDFGHHGHHNGNGS